METLNAAKRFKQNPSQFEVLLIGASVGGLKTVRMILSSLPESFQLPILVVQHRPADSSSCLDKYFALWTDRTVIEAEDKIAIKPGHIFVAPCDYHMLVEGNEIALSTAETVQGACPSIDLLFESAAKWYKSKAIGIYLGESEDGLEGLRALEDAGSMIVIEQTNDYGNLEKTGSSIFKNGGTKFLTVEQIVTLLESAVASPRRLKH